MTLYRVLADIAEPNLVSDGNIPSGSYIYYTKLDAISSHVEPQYIETIES